MSKHTYKSCPHCLTRYDSYSSSYSAFLAHQGSPLRICSRCGQDFIDTDYTEPAFCPPPGEPVTWECFVAPLFPFGLYAIGAGIAAYYTASGLFLGFSAICVAMYIYYAIKARFPKPETLQKKLAAYESSLRRVANPDYIKLLLDNECKVPKKYLAEHHPELLDYRRKGWTHAHASIFQFHT